MSVAGLGSPPIKAIINIIPKCKIPPLTTPGIKWCSLCLCKTLVLNDSCFCLPANAYCFISTEWNPPICCAVPACAHSFFNLASVNHNGSVYSQTQWITGMNGSGTGQFPVLRLFLLRDPFDGKFRLKLFSDGGFKGVVSLYQAVAFPFKTQELFLNCGKGNQRTI